MSDDGVPTMVYRRPQPGDETTETMSGVVAWKIVNLAPGEKIPDGWRASYADAAAAAEQAPEVEHETPPDPSAPSELDVLRAHAETLGIKVDGRWSAAKLKKKIEAEEA